VRCGKARGWIGPVTVLGVTSIVTRGTVVVVSIVVGKAVVDVVAGADVVEVGAAVVDVVVDAVVVVGRVEVTDPASSACTAEHAVSMPRATIAGPYPPKVRR
jgi:hypothetical protein